jgi:hypothetical protein
MLRTRAKPDQGQQRHDVERTAAAFLRDRGQEADHDQKLQKFE